MSKWEKRPQELVARYIRKVLYHNDDDDESEQPEDEAEAGAAGGGDTQKAPVEEAE